MMENTYWYRQSDKPLFPDLVWSRPENKKFAGKLLVIGGNMHSFTAPAEAYQAALDAGIGVARVILPQSLEKTLGHAMPHISFAPSNRSGGFAKSALADWLEQANWADAVLLVGDTARNSETAIVMESFIEKYSGKLIINQDCLDQFVVSPKKLFERPDTLLVPTLGQLQKMWPRLIADRLKVLKFANSLVRNVELLHELTTILPAFIVTKQIDQLILATNGSVCTTTDSREVWRTKTAAKAAVWWIQNPEKPFEAVATAFYE